MREEWCRNGRRLRRPGRCRFGGATTDVFVTSISLMRGYAALGCPIATDSALGKLEAGKITAGAQQMQLESMCPCAKLYSCILDSVNLMANHFTLCVARNGKSLSNSGSRVRFNMHPAGLHMKELHQQSRRLPSDSFTMISLSRRDASSKSTGSCGEHSPLAIRSTRDNLEDPTRPPGQKQPATKSEQCSATASCFI